VPDSGPDAGGSCFYYAFDPALKFLCWRIRKALKFLRWRIR
jgi:hypothetical protein